MQTANNNSHMERIPTQAKPAPAEAAPAPQAPVYEGLKKIKDQEELLGYVRHLENMNIEQSAELNVIKKAPVQQAPPVEQTVTSTNQSELDRIFTDPNSVLKEQATQIKQEIRSEFEQKEKEKQELSDFWTSFYKENPELNEFEKIVGMTWDEQRSKISNLPIDQGKAVLAKEAKAMLTEFKAKINPATTLNETNTQMLSASGETPPQVVVQKKRMSFVDQCAELRQRKMKAT